MTNGEALKKALNLEKLTYVVIQKVIGMSLPIFIVTFDSRHPQTYIPYNRLLKLKFSTLKQVISSKPKSVLSDINIKVKKVKILPPYDIESYDRIVSTRSLIFTRDLGGYWYSNPKLYECIDNKVKEIV
jgi:hypothetical protein